MKFSFLGYLPLIFTTFKSMMDNAKHDFKVKTFDQTKEKIDVMEHIITKIEKKLGECRAEIDELRKEIMFSRLINVVLMILIILLILFL